MRGRVVRRRRAARARRVPAGRRRPAALGDARCRAWRRATRWRRSCAMPRAGRGCVRAARLRAFGREAGRAEGRGPDGAVARRRQERRHAVGPAGGTRSVPAGASGRGLRVAVRRDGGARVLGGGARHGAPGRGVGRGACRPAHASRRRARRRGRGARRRACPGRGRGASGLQSPRVAGDARPHHPAHRDRRRRGSRPRPARLRRMARGRCAL